MKSDFLIIGAGIIGVSIAQRLKDEFPDASIHVIDKESISAAHSSGRNSGVLHAGFYYTTDSFKAKFTMRGNEALTLYCKSKNLAINKCGKLVVAQSEAELIQLDELLRRGQLNGSQVHEVTAKEALELEPRVKTLDRALWSPNTSTIDPTEVLRSLIHDAEIAGVKFFWAESYRKKLNNKSLQTSAGHREAGYLVNAAGLYADKIAHDYGVGENLRILPFKGLYLYSEEPAGSFQRHIYPVPDPHQPFLGVHFTQTVSGKTKIGPTAIPAFWREQYSGFENFHAQEFFELCFRQLGLLAFSNFDFMKLAKKEFLKYSRSHMVKIAGRLATDISPSQYKTWGRPGIRAQLYDIKKRKLEMDFKLEGDENSFHVLNAISPGFTCALPFSELIVAEISKKLRGN